MSTTYINFTPAERERATDLAEFLRRQGYRNCVFVGCDESGTARHAHKRGSIARNKPEATQKVCHGENIQNVTRKIVLIANCKCGTNMI